MIITVTGKPCSGKGAASKIFCKKYGFDYLCAGDIMREIATQKGYENVLDFQQHYPNVADVDRFIDNTIAKIGDERENDNLLIDSRLAWHFVNKSFKVFIDVDIDTASFRLLNAKRENEKASTAEIARQMLENRWAVENDRYDIVYQINNKNLSNYDCVIDSTTLTAEQVADKIYEEFKKFVSTNKF